MLMKQMIVIDIYWKYQGQDKSPCDISLGLYNKICLCPGSKDRGILFFSLLFVCLSIVNFKLRYNFWTVSLSVVNFKLL